MIHETSNNCSYVSSLKYRSEEDINYPEIELAIDLAITETLREDSARMSNTFDTSTATKAILQPTALLPQTKTATEALVVAAENDEKPLAQSRLDGYIRQRWLMLQPFQHTRLPLTEGSFRLFKLMDPSKSDALCCEIFHANLEDWRRDYVALSYECGDPEDRKIIRVDGRSLAISANLHAFLEVLRAKTPNASRPFWADAICIDQSSDTEKNHQIQMMADIYRFPKEVYCWLGPEGDDSSWLLEQLKPAHHDPATWVTRLPFAPGRLALAARALLSRTYWTRLWTVQEIVLGPRAILFCGAKTLLWGNCNLYYNLGLLPSLLPKPKDGEDIILRNVTQRLRRTDEEIYDTFSSITEHYLRYVSDAKSFEDLFDRHSQKLCSLPHDKLLALLGLARIEWSEMKELVPRYDRPPIDVLFQILQVKRPRRSSIPPLTFVGKALAALKVDSTQLQDYFRDREKHSTICVTASKRKVYKVQRSFSLKSLNDTYKKLVLPIARSVAPAVGDWAISFGVWRDIVEPPVILVRQQTITGQATITGIALDSLPHPGWKVRAIQSLLACFPGVFLHPYCHNYHASLETDVIFLIAFAQIWMSAEDEAVPHWWTTCNGTSSRTSEDEIFPDKKYVVDLEVYPPL